jgi:hypothetical protein
MASVSIKAGKHSKRSKIKYKIDQAVSDLRRSKWPAERERSCWEVRSVD